VPLTEQRRGAVALVSVTLAAFGVTMIVVSSLTVASVYNLAYAKSLRSIDRARLAVRLASWHYNARVEETFQQGLAAVLAAQGKDTAAASLIKQADAAMVALIARNPYSLTGYSLRTAFLLEVGTRMNDRTYLEEALQAANGGLKVQPTSIEMATKKATVLTSLGRYAEAADTMSTIWELYPADPAPGVLYADSLIRAGRLAEAKRVVGVLETRFPSDPEVLRVKGLVSGG
jgi:tetratricopeptide (TPR) repeat protein